MVVPTGWLPELEDWGFLASATAPTFSAPAGFVPPPAMSFRGILKVENQNPLNSCVGHGLSSGLECLAYLQSRVRVQLSRMFAYIAAQRTTGIKTDDGANIAGGIRAMAETGCCEESELPYTGRYFNKLPAAAVEAAGKHRILGHQDLNTYEEVRDWIAMGKGPVVFGVTWYRRLIECQGRVTPDALRGGSVGGHCMVFAGYSGEKDSAGDLLLDNLNSHGTGWGDGGWAQWTPDAIRRALDQERRSRAFIGITDITGFDAARLVDFSKVV